VERRVDLHAREALRVPTQPSRGREIGWIDGASPFRVLPPAGTDDRLHTSRMGASDRQGAPMPSTWGLTKEAAHYRPAPKLEVRCDACAFMFPRAAFGSCKYVRGVIRAEY